MSTPAGDERFCHEALLYAGHDDFVQAAASFIREGIAAGEPVLVVVSRAKIASLRAALADSGESVRFADMADVGANPGRIIPAWRDFVDAHAATGRRLRGIGEPVWAERSAAELLECQRHETLLNLAFAEAPGFTLLCPYDITTLAPATLAKAERSHPHLREGAARRRSAAYAEVAGPSTLDAPLPAPTASTRELAFGWQSLAPLRFLAAREAARAGFLSGRIAELVLAVNEVATNSLRHGGGEGRARVWRDGGTVVCEVSDAGRVTSALVDRQRPGTQPDARRGLWLVNQLCDLVQLRSSAAGTTVRLPMQAAA